MRVIGLAWMVSLNARSLTLLMALGHVDVHSFIGAFHHYLPARHCRPAAWGLRGDGTDVASHWEREREKERRGGEWVQHHPKPGQRSSAQHRRCTTSIEVPGDKNRETAASPYPEPWPTPYFGRDGRRMPQTLEKRSTARATRKRKEHSWLEVARYGLWSQLSLCPENNDDDNNNNNNNNNNQNHEILRAYHDAAAYDSHYGDDLLPSRGRLGMRSKEDASGQQFSFYLGGSCYTCAHIKPWQVLPLCPFSSTYPTLPRPAPLQDYGEMSVKSRSLIYKLIRL